MNRHDAKNANFGKPDARIDALARTVLDAMRADATDIIELSLLKL